MGHIYVQVQITGQKGKRTLKDIPVDTGATYTVVESSLIDAVKASPVPGRIRLELGNGKKVTARAYAVRIRIRSWHGPAIVLTFAGAKSVVGVGTLESLGLNVNLKKRRLEPSRPPGMAYFYSARSVMSMRTRIVDSVDHNDISLGYGYGHEARIGHGDAHGNGTEP